MHWSGRFRNQLAAVAVALVAVGGALFASPAAAQPPSGNQPAVVLTLAPMNKLTTDVAYVAEAVGQPEAGGTFTVLATAYTQGIDPSRPTAVFLHLVNGNPEPTAVLPTADVEAILTRLAADGFIPPADKLDDGTLVIAAGPSLMYIRQAGDWAVIARTPELLNAVPADPLPLIGDLGTRFDIGVRLNVQQVPIELREMLLEQLTQGFDQAMAQQAGNSDEVISLGNSQLEQLQQLVRESDRLQFGINIDPAQRQVRVESEFTAVAGSALAAMTNAQQPIPSMFSAVLRGDAAVRYHAAGSLSPEAAESGAASLELAIASLRNLLDSETKLSDADKAAIEELSAQLLAILGSSLAEGKYDAGMVGVAGADTLKIAGGIFVHDGNEITPWLRNLASKIPPGPKSPKFTFDAANYKGVALHTISLDVPAHKDKPRRLFGDQLVLTIGAAPKAIYFSLGKDAQVALQGLIDTADVDSGNPAARGLGQARVKLLPILQLAHSINQDEIVAALIADLSRFADRDYVSVDSSTIDNGQRGTVVIAEGILRAIGVGIRENQAAKMRQLQSSGF